MNISLRLLLFFVAIINVQFLCAQSMEIELSSEGVVFPRMNTETRDGLVASQGQCIYNLDSGSIDCFDGVGWSSTLTDKSSSSDFNRKDFDVIRPDDLTLSSDFGYSMDMHGSYMVVGDSYEDDKGAAYIFHHNGIEWYQQARLIEENGDDDYQFGHSVSLSDQYAVIGSVLTQIQGEEVGVVYVYKKENQNWSISDTLIAYDGQDADRFGESVMIHDDFIIVGACSANSQSPSSGKVYIYQLQNDEWELDTAFTPMVAQQSGFGQFVAITDQYAVVSAVYDQSVSDERGSVFVYKRGIAGWEFDQTIRASDGSLSRQFGTAITIDAENLIIGAAENGIINADSSQAYCYKKNLTTDLWEEKQILKNPEGSHIRNFGRKISLFQNTLVFLTRDATDNFNRISEVRIYKKVGASWMIDKVFTPLGITEQLDSVLLYEDWLLIGSRSFSTDDVLKGGVFVF